MDHRSFEKLTLLQAASLGDDTGVRHALESGANINVSDGTGRTALTCVITGDSWMTLDASNASFLTKSRLNALKFIVSHPSISLYTLNAPHESLNDVTPLGMAAWLGMPQVIEILLDGSKGAVAVDGMDVHGATPLMYAARDGSFTIVQQLLAHGARPDMRDMNYHTPIQFALSHARVLWSCENFLRHRRWNEFQNGNKRNLCFPSQLPISKLSPYADISFSPDFPPLNAFAADDLMQFTDSLIQTIVTADIPVMYSLLFPPLSPSTIHTNYGPVFVNLPDAEGWSAIHYCVSVHPSIEVLDALYRAGADVDLFTVANQWTPLHCLARTARPTDDYTQTKLLYQFTVHLIRDLRAPLAARDQNGETCLHIAAELGGCIDVLKALIDCDTTGSIRTLRNSRGLTALEVAQPCFRSAFVPDNSMARPPSSLSLRTIRPTTSRISISSIPEWVPSTSTAQHAPSNTSFDADIKLSSQTLLDKLRLTSVGCQLKRPVELDNLQRTLKDTGRIGDRVLSHFRAQTEAAARDLRDMRQTFKHVDALWNQASHNLEEQLEKCPGQVKMGLSASHRRKNRGSEDSQVTAVANEVEEASSIVADKPKSQSSANRSQHSSTYVDVSVSTEPPKQVFEAMHAATGRRTVPWPVWLDGFILNADSSMYKAHLDNLLEIEQVLFPREGQQNLENIPNTHPPKEHKFKNLLKGRKKDNIPTNAADKRGNSKFKTWLKKKVIVSDAPLKLALVHDLDDPNCAVVGEISKNTPVLMAEDLPTTSSPPPELDAHEELLRSCQATIMTASQDLSGIDERLDTVDHYISTACHSVARAERIIRRALKVRGDNLEHLRTNPTLSCQANVSLFPDMFTSRSTGLPDSCSTSPPRSIISSTPSSSACSSTASLASTLDADESEDIRALRRLLLRKIDARVEGALDEIDKTGVWLRVVREVLHDVKKRTAL